jgi:hypothetical protein
MRDYLLYYCLFSWLIASVYPYIGIRHDLGRLAGLKQRSIDVRLHDASINDIASFAVRTLSLSDIFSQSLSKATSGGIAGASAAGVQVLSLMWLR